ncbi:MAG: hypothetical protein IJT94_09270 [Oscillibacter sp.]|nr:hypothetical protein [Oscillibacter sp.]
MMRHGRPYSNENGWVDKALITARPADEMESVMSWIRKNILPAGEILPGRTSYGLKHLLQHDTGLYLTNNEFKDAMLLSGFEPVNPKELNWRYRILLTREINSNPSPFFKWTADKYTGQDSLKGDFADDMVRDFGFPTVARKDVILRYLARHGACDGAVRAFKELWSEYEREAD